MKRISASIPTVIKKSNSTKQTSKKKTIESPSSVVVFQHNDLVEARYSLTLQEKRLILWLISKIHPDEEDFKKHKLSVQEFMKLMELKGNANYKELQKITLGLMKKVLVIKRPEEKTLTQVNWINYAHYKEGSGKIEVSFSDAMKPFLLHLKSQFTAIELTDLMQFTSIHAIRIYELLKQYQNIGERIISIPEIKECCGVIDKLKKYNNFEKKILLIAKREINEKSDISFEFERIKDGRKIVAIKFLISKNKAYELKNNPEIHTKEVKRKPSIVSTLKDFGLSMKIINQLLKEYTAEALDDAVRVVDIQISTGQVRNAKAMLLTAIKERWNPDKYLQRKTNN
jgi:plasmid replication initiation protein